jgi:Na+/proline symporter
LAPAPAAGAGAPFFSDEALIGIGAAAVLAGVLVAVTSSSSSTTTTTHH